MPMFVMPHISVPIIARYMRFNAFPAAPTNGVIAACTSEATKFLTYYSVGTTQKPASHCNDVEAAPCLVALVELPLLASWLHFAADTSLFSLIHMMATPTIHEGCTAFLSTGKQQSETPSVQSSVDTYLGDSSQGCKQTNSDSRAAETPGNGSYSSAPDLAVIIQPMYVTVSIQREQISIRIRTIKALHHAQICLLHGKCQCKHNRQHHQSPTLHSSARPIVI